MHNPKPPPLLADKLALRLTEAVYVSGLSRSTLYKLIAENRLRSVKAAGRRLIMRSDLERYFAELRSGA